MDSNQLREYQLSYCRFCIHRLSDRHRGLLCGKTLNYPNFDQNCSNFSKDYKEILHVRASDRAIQPSIHDYVMLGYDYLFSSKGSVESFQVKKSKKSFIVIGALMLLPLISALIFFLIDDASQEQETILGAVVVIALAVDFLVLFILGFQAVIQNNKVLQLDQTGLRINGTHKSWNEYISYKVYWERSPINALVKDYYLQFIVLGGLKEDTIHLSGLSASRMSIIKALNRFERGYA